MNYRNELIELMPLLKSHLKKLIRKYPFFVQHEQEDIFQDCMVNALGSANKEIRNPKNYFIGVVNKTVLVTIKKYIDDEKLKERCKANLRIKDCVNDSIMSEIDSKVSGTNKLSQDIWHCLKEFEGSNKKTSKALKRNYNTIGTYKARLKKVYKNVLENVF